jgi:hypothetical protein
MLTHIYTSIIIYHKFCFGTNEFQNIFLHGLLITEGDGMGVKGAGGKFCIAGCLGCPGGAIGGAG